MTLDSPTAEEVDQESFSRKGSMRRSIKSKQPVVKESKSFAPSVSWPTPRSPIVRRRLNPADNASPSRPGHKKLQSSSLRRTQSLEKSPVGPRLSKARSSLREVKKPAKKPKALSSLTKKSEVAERILSPERTIGIPVIEVPGVFVPEVTEHASPEREVPSAIKEREVDVKEDTESVRKDSLSVEVERILSSSSDNVQQVLRKFKSELGSRENLRKTINCVEETCGSLITAKTSLDVDDSPAIKCLRILERSQSPPEDIKKRLAEVRRPSLERFEPALVVKAPSDITALRGARVVLRATYKGHPEPRVKWLRAVS